MSAPQHQRGVPLSPETEAVILQMYADKAPRREIMDATGVGKSTVSDVLNRNGIELRAPKTRLSPEKEAEVVKLYKEGKERKVIVALTSVPNSTITWVLKRAGIDRTHKRRSSVPSERTLQVKAMWFAGKSQTEIAEKLDTTPAAVAGIIFRNKWKRDEAYNVVNSLRASRENGARMGAINLERGRASGRVPKLRLVSDNPKPKLPKHPGWAGAPRVRGVTMTPRKLGFIRRFLEANWRLDEVAHLFDVSADAITEALREAA
jgi:predicted DNA-binding protein YlxM (UPF0122 family)